MKKFSSFLIEASLSQASMRAKQMGLRGDGHGGWYNSQGEFVAKTIAGELKFFTKGQKVGEKDSPKASSNQPIQQKPKVQNTQPQKASGQTTIPLTIVFGKFNPPSEEHGKIFDSAKRISAGGDFKIYPSRVQDPKKNPMDPDTKIKYMKKLFPDYADNIVNDEEVSTIFDALQASENDGYSAVRLVVGSDRVSEFRSLAIKYNGNLYNFDDIEVVPGGEKENNSNNPTESKSAKMRQAASKDDFNTFKSSLPKNVKEKEAKQMFKIVRKNMEESASLWEISPKLDYKTLRENYISNKIFKLNENIINLNTGMSGKIIRRGTNYLICTSDNDVMFKSWITDVMEKKDSIIRKKTNFYSDFQKSSKKSFTGNSGVTADNRLVGTNPYRKYVMRLTNMNKIYNFD